MTDAHFKHSDASPAEVPQLSLGQREAALLEGQKRALELAVHGAPLMEILDVLAQTVEAHASSQVVASILLMDLDGKHLRHGAAPTLPDSYNRAVDGIPVGPMVGSCGAAAFLGQTVIAEDIALDPRWSDFRELALAHGLRACWSTPILSAQREVLGTFALYYREPCNPAPRDKATVDLIAHTAAIIIERQRETQGRHRAEAERERFFTLAPDMFCIAGLDAHFRRVNLAFVRTLGWTEEELLAKPFLELVHPDDVEGTRAEVAQLAQGASVRHFETRYRCKDGRYKWLAWSASPVRSEGYMYAAARDITESKRAAAEAREAAEVLKLVADAGAVLAQSLEFKPTWEAAVQLAVPLLADWALLDLEGEDGQIGRVAIKQDDPALDELAERIKRFPPKWLTDSQHPVSLSVVQPKTRLITLVDDALLRMWAVHGAEHLEVARAIGFHSVLSVPLIARGRLLGTLSLLATAPSRHFGAREVTMAEELAQRAAQAIDNARLFAAVQAERARVEEASHLKDDFLATVSHELRTPLTSILGYATLLRGTAPMTEERRERAIAVIERNARAQKQLIEDLLDVSRIVSGKLRLDLQPVEPLHVLETALEGVRPTAEAKDIKLRATLDPSAGVVSGDAGRLQQVVWNLLTNAIKFTPKGGRVTVELARVDSHIKLSVADTGQGISPDFLPHVFERFRQADASSKRAQGGLGLGLAIVKSLVEIHGGNVEAHSAGEGQGSTFTVSLPLMPPCPRAAGEARLHAPEARSSAALDPRPELKGVHILLVDDEPDTREVLAWVLQSCGASVSQASSAAEALTMMDAETPDLLVSDIGMPCEDGYGLLQRVRQRSAEAGGKVPAVALTAYARSEDRIRALRAGFTMHVPKPVETSEFLVVIASVLGRVTGA